MSSRGIWYPPSGPPGPPPRVWPWLVATAAFTALVVAAVTTVVLDPRPGVPIDGDLHEPHGMVTEAPIEDDASEVWNAKSPPRASIFDVFEVDDVLIVEFSGTDPRITAYDAEGKQIWTQEAVNRIDSTSASLIYAFPSSSGESIYVYDGEVMRAVQTHTGEVLWELDRQVHSVRQYGDVLVVSNSEPDSGYEEKNEHEDSMTGKVSLLDADTGREISSRPGLIHGFTPAGVIYGDHDGKDARLLTPTGDGWEAELDGRSVDIFNRVIVSDQVAMVAVETEELDSLRFVALDLRTGYKLWETDSVGHTSKLLGTGADGALVTLVEESGSDHASLVSYDEHGSPTPEDVPVPEWPMVLQVTGHGPTYVDSSTGTIVSPSGDVQTYDSPIMDLTTDGPYLVPQAGELTLADWEGNTLRTVTLADNKPLVFALDEGVLTFDYDTSTTRVYR